VTFSSIPSTYRNLSLCYVTRTSNASYQNIGLRMNNDSSAIYSWQTERNTGVSTMAAQGTVNDTSINVGFAVASSAGTGEATSGQIAIPNYKQTTYQKAAHFAWALRDTVNTNFYNANGSGVWNSTAAITRLDLIVGAGNFPIGSLFQLYGDG